MDIVKQLSRLNAIGKYLLIAVLAVNFVSVLAAGGGGTSGPTATTLTSALKSLCTTAKSFLGAVAMILVVLAGGTYAVGQVMGAETRARAAVWATAMLTGALIGIVIYVIMPPLIGIMMGTGGGADPCSDATLSISGTATS
jgi:hypothetical protein